MNSFRNYLLSATGLAILVVAGTLTISKALAESDNFTTIDCPGATFNTAAAINPRGDIVGRCTIAGVRHGFLLSGREEDAR